MTTPETLRMVEKLLNRKSEKKQKPTGKESEIVEDLERSLKKDDPLVESNTYDSEAEKNLKNLRNSGGLKGKENSDLTKLIEENGTSKNVSKAKKKKTKKNIEFIGTKEEEDVYAVVKKLGKKNKSEQQKNKQEESIPLEPKLPEDTSQHEEDEERAETSAKAFVEGEETVPKSVVRPKKKSKKSVSKRKLPSLTQDQSQPETQQTDIPEEPAVTDPVSNAPVNELEEEQVVDDGTILGVTVHYCDYIRVDPKYVCHPVVKVSIVNSATGELVNKHDSTRHVSSYYESDSTNLIVPLMTHPYDFKINRSLIPRWEELLIFNESFSILTHHSVSPEAVKPILFFVIRDFVTMEKVNNQRGNEDVGWYNVAWAFLKLVSNNGNPNAGKRMRLQLFYPPRTRNPSLNPNIDMVYDWWLNHQRVRYPGTLFITVKPIIPQLDLESSQRSLTPHQKEEGSHTFNQLNESLEHMDQQGKDDKPDDFAEIQRWSRLPGQTCKIPNAPFLKLWAGSDGAFTMQFSHRGTRLAAACRHESTYPILIYTIPGGEEAGIITGHQQLVYDLKWSNDDRYLLSASADGTAQVWDLAQKEKPVHTLPHPCYVYTASYHPTASHFIATGGYDSTLRVWNIASVNSQLTQELDGHKAIINSIIFDSTGLTMFSGDGAGLIICWDCRSYEKVKRSRKTNWSLKYKIEDRDLAGVCINHLQFHPRNNKILVHCRDSTVRILDARIHSIKKFTGLLNYRQLLRSSVTPCGSLIFSGSEDGFVYVWNIETGDQVAIYNELGYLNAIHTVIYHPHDHMVAFCSYAPSQSVLLYKFNSAVATMEAGFKLQGPSGVKEEEAPTINAQIEAVKSSVTLQGIRNKLDSVLADTLNTSSNLGGSIGLTGTTDPLSSQRSNHDVSYKSSNLLAPSFLSPHASPEARAVAHQYMKSGVKEQGGRPATVGGSPYRTGIAPDVSFSTDKDGNRRLDINPAPGTEEQCVVVVLFEYQANRSDELTVDRGDMIKVLYKDSPNWWFGEKISDGKQGYFPSNYVEEQMATGKMDQSNTQTPVFGVPNPEKEKKVYALKKPGGGLTFYSQSESEGDDDRLSLASMSSRQRRREAKLKESLVKSQPISALMSQTPTKQPDMNYPKSILQKDTGKPKMGATGSSSDPPTIKEVSFADEKDEKNPKARQNLLNSIQAALSQSEQDSKSKNKTSTKAQLHQKKQVIKPKTVPKKSSMKKQAPAYDETTFTEDEIKASTSAPVASTPKLAPNFSVLKSVQAILNEKDQSEFSQSVLGGHGISTPTKSSASSFKPSVHSTAVKKVRKPVENEDEPPAAGSVTRKARPLLKILGKNEASIPLTKISQSKSGPSTSSGHSNPAFDHGP